VYTTVHTTANVQVQSLARYTSTVACYVTIVYKCIYYFATVVSTTVHVYTPVHVNTSVHVYTTLRLYTTVNLYTTVHVSSDVQVITTVHIFFYVHMLTTVNLMKCRQFIALSWCPCSSCYKQDMYASVRKSIMLTL